MTVNSLGLFLWLRLFFSYIGGGFTWHLENSVKMKLLC